MKKSLGAKTIVYPTPVFIVGTYDKSGKPNAMNVAWGGLCCSSPPCVAISVRKATYTYGNIVERKAFTINIPSEAYVKEADYFGVASGAKADKFSVTKLTPVKLHRLRRARPTSGAPASAAEPGRPRSRTRAPPRRARQRARRCAERRTSAPWRQRRRSAIPQGAPQASQSASFARSASGGSSGPGGIDVLSRAERAKILSRQARASSALPKS